MQTNTSDPKWIVQLSWIDCLTLSSVITTSLAVALILDGYFHAAIATLFIAMTADAADGYLARALNKESQLGRYLDGFMDVLIYLVVPALALYQFGFDGGWGVFLMLMVAAGCVRLSAFNQTGNIQQEAGPAYMGMPVFWSVFICAGYFVILELGCSALVAKLILAGSLSLFSWNMLQRKPFFKFTSMMQMLSLTMGGFILFMTLQLSQYPDRYDVSIIYNAWCLQIPVVVAGVFHMWVVTKNKYFWLCVPVNVERYGNNKTLRGFVVMPLAAAVGTLPWLLFDVGDVINHHSMILVGTIMGLVYVLAELPNSYFKRRLGAAPGHLPKKAAGLFLALDQLDSGVGIALALWLLNICSVSQALVFALSFPLTALVVKSLLFSLGLKKTAS